MKTISQHGKPALPLLVVLVLSLLGRESIAQTNAFTYQGRLTDNGSAANGSYDLTFQLFDAPAAGAQIGSTLTNANEPVSNGLFTVVLNFGSGVFAGADRWLQIGVRTNGSAQNFVPLNSRQLLTPTPYATFASVSASLNNGYGNIASGAQAAVGGGALNFANGGYATIGGGYLNTNAGNYSFVGAGSNNLATGHCSTIAGGSQNTISTNADYALIGGGFGNIIEENAFQPGLSNTWFSTVGGGYWNTIQSQAQDSTIGGGGQNTIQTRAEASTIGGGRRNTIGTNALYSTVSGGSGNTIGMNAGVSTISGGSGNTIGMNAGVSTIGGGARNTIQTNTGYSTIGGGHWNTIKAGADDSTIGGGYENTIQTGAYGSTIGGGYENTNSGPYAAIPGGLENVAGTNAFAAGRRAKALHTGSFVWGDSTDANIASSAQNQFTVRASGGVRFFSNIGATAGVSLSTGGTSWGVISDRNAKKNFEPVDGETVLEKLASVPVLKWNYQWEPDNATPNIGPTAQDFKAAFYPGRDDKSITTLEFDGVELAAIKALNEKLEKVMKDKDTRIAELEKRLEKVESLLSRQN